MNTWDYGTPWLAQLHMCELQAIAESERLARQARLPQQRRGLRRRVGGVLITTGELIAFGREPQVCAEPC